MSEHLEKCLAEHVGAVGHTGDETKFDFTAGYRAGMLRAAEICDAEKRELYRIEGNMLPRGESRLLDMAGAVRVCEGNIRAEAIEREAGE